VPETTCSGLFDTATYHQRRPPEQCPGGTGPLWRDPQGMQRLAFSPADIAGREYTISLMRRADLETCIDPAGNIIGHKAGADPGLPAIALGSHIDTVPNGGKYDGAWASWALLR
jgi:hypothetical protein